MTSMQMQLPSCPYDLKTVSKDSLTGRFDIHRSDILVKMKHFNPFFFPNIHWVEGSVNRSSVHHKVDKDNNKAHRDQHRALKGKRTGNKDEIKRDTLHVVHG